MVFLNCIDLHVSVLLHTFVLLMRLELECKAQDLTRKKIKIFHEDQRKSCAFSGEKSGKLRGKKSKILSEPCNVSSSIFCFVLKWP